MSQAASSRPGHANPLCRIIKLAEALTRSPPSILSQIWAGHGRATRARIRFARRRATIQPRSRLFGPFQIRIPAARRIISSTNTMFGASARGGRDHKDAPSCQVLRPQQSAMPSISARSCRRCLDDRRDDLGRTGERDRAVDPLAAVINHDEPDQRRVAGDRGDRHSDARKNPAMGDADGLRDHDRRRGAQAWPGCIRAPARHRSARGDRAQAAQRGRALRARTQHRAGVHPVGRIAGNRANGAAVKGGSGASLHDRVSGHRRIGVRGSYWLPG